MELINCHYCNARISQDISTCSQCGAPNEPEPVPWHVAYGHRLKSALTSKTKAVWSDRLAALLPISFILAAISTFLTAKAGIADNTGNLLNLIISVSMMLCSLTYYPGWYEQDPEKRKDQGLILFLVTLLFYGVSYFHFFG